MEAPAVPPVEPPMALSVEPPMTLSVERQEFEREEVTEDTEGRHVVERAEGGAPVEAEGHASDRCIGAVTEYVQYDPTVLQGASLRLVKDAPSRFCNQQYGKRHHLELQAALLSEDGAVIVGKRCVVWLCGPDSEAWKLPQSRCRGHDAKATAGRESRRGPSSHPPPAPSR